MKKNEILEKSVIYKKIIKQMILKTIDLMEINDLFLKEKKRNLKKFMIF